MAHIKNEAAYEAAMARIEELLKVVSDDMPLTDPRMAELDMLSELVEEYEDLNYPFPPSQKENDPTRSSRPLRHIGTAFQRNSARQDRTIPAIST